MTRTEASTARADQIATDLLVLPLYEGPKDRGPEPGPGVREVGQAMGADLLALAGQAGLTGAIGDTLVLSTLGAVPSGTIALTGLGPRGDADANEVRRATMYAVGATKGYASVASTLPQVGDDQRASARSYAEGVLLGSYSFQSFKSAPDLTHLPVGSITALVTGDRRPANDGLRTGRIHAEAANWARDLVNTPSAAMTPPDLAEAARAMATEHGLECRIWTQADLEDGGFGGILAVGRASSHEPRLIELAYHGGRKGRTPYAITGKGITFDAGGMFIKKASWLETMKVDMAGAAAAIAAMRAVAELKLPINVIAAIGSAENMPGADANLPGDIITHRGGRTTEVIDPDAEGRLLLADVLAYLSEQHPRVIIDSATLTDTGIGEGLWAIFGNDQGLVDALRRAGEEAGEPGWQYPLHEPYRHHTETDHADGKNASWEGADTLHSGLFLQSFVDPTIPWAHLDIGNTAFLDFSRHDEWPDTGATGNPVRVILRYLEDQARRR